MGKFKTPTRFAEYVMLMEAISGLRGEAFCNTQYVPGGYNRAWYLVADELGSSCLSLAESGDLSSISMGLRVQPVFSAEPDEFVFDAGGLARTKWDLKKDAANYVARVVAKPEPCDNAFGFRWIGRLLVVSIKLGSDRVRSDKAARSYEIDGDIAFVRYEQPNGDDIREIVSEFRKASKSVKKASTNRLKAAGFGNADFSMRNVSDGLLQFATMAPFKTIAFGHGLGRDAIKRAHISLEADVKAAKKADGPDQLRMLHEWWSYRDADQDDRLKPLLIN